MIAFYSDNLIDSATISASSENLLFPKSNLTDFRRSKVFRSTSNSDSLVFDFGSVKSLDSIIIVDEPRKGFGVTSLTIQLNSTNTWTSPAFSQVLTINSTHGYAFADFSVQSFRYARLVMTSSLGYCELSNLFMGQKLSFASGLGIDFGWTYQDKDLSIIKENRYGQKFTDIISRQRVLNFAINSMNKDELDQVLKIYDDKGVRKPFFVKIGSTTMINDFTRFSGMFFLNSIPAITNKSFGLYDISMNLEEAM